MYRAGWLLLSMMATAPRPGTALLIPYDMLPARIGDANLIEIRPSDMLDATYRAAAGPVLDLTIVKERVSKGPRCVAGKGEQVARLEIGSHPACYSAASSRGKDQRILNWRVRDFEVRLSLRDGTDFAEGRRLLTPAAEAAAAWIDSLFREGGPDGNALQANREATAYRISFMRGLVEQEAKQRPERRKSMEIQSPSQWYLQP
jgi:hypothetical protein